MKLPCFHAFCFILFAVSSQSQEPDLKELNQNMNTLAKEFNLSPEQKFRLLKIDYAYLADMNGIKDRADIGYNPPKHIQHQHAHALLRHIIALKEVLNDEQFQKIQQQRYDIYLYADWLVAFYKKNKLPTLQQAVEKRMKERAKTEQL